MTRHSVHVKVDGRTYAGAYTVDRKVLTVATNYGKKTAQVGHQVSHETLAHQLLHELVREEKGPQGLTTLASCRAGLVARPRPKMAAIPAADPGAA